MFCSPLYIKTFEKGGNQMWGITGINFRTSIVFNLLLFFILFADDTNLFMSHKNLNALIVQMNRELKVEGDYTLLILSISKTQFILLDRKETKPIIE